MVLPNSLLHESRNRHWSDGMRKGKPHRKVDLGLRFEVTDWQVARKKIDWLEGE